MAKWCLLLLLAGCVATPPDCPDCDADGVLDRRRAWPELPFDDGIRFDAPDLLLQPGAEAILCYSFVWEGPDSAVISYIPRFDGEIGHHLLLKALEGDNGGQDGTLYDCTGQDFMPPPPVLFEAAGVSTVQDTNVDWLLLPPGVAFPFEHGQRVLMDMHFINFYDKPVRLNAAFDLEFMDPADVVEWAGSYTHDSGQIGVPPGARADIRFTCPFDRDLTVYSFGAHMHLFGTSFRLELLRVDGSVEELMHVDPWEDDFRNHPPIWSPEGGMAVREGDALRTTCSYHNDSSEELDFPAEMCTTFGSASPLAGGTYCEPAEPERILY